MQPHPALFNKPGMLGHIFTKAQTQLRANHRARQNQSERHAASRQLNDIARDLHIARRINIEIQLR